MSDIEKVEKGIKACWSEYFSHKCCDCPYVSDRNDKKCIERLGADAIRLIEKQKEENIFLKRMQLQTIHNMKEEDIGDAVAKVLGLKRW